MIIKGQKINDRYQIVRMIGEGGMANVYLAYDTILDRNVAVKILRGDLSGDEKFVRRFQREAISASSLSHPNIVEMYDVGEDDGKYFIVMEYVDGKTLKSLVKKRGALTLPEVMDIMKQLTSAIACAHDSYIIHRDIKPQNVMILEDGRVKITDFGIAMALNSHELTQTNSVMGSVHYLPPEQANGTGSTIKSDIYSLGILMYELLTGKLPFKGENAVEIAIKQMKEPIPSVRNLNPEIPQSVENIILKACAKNPKNRYENIGEMNDDVVHALDPEHAYDEKVIYAYPEQENEEVKQTKVTRSKLNRNVQKNANVEEKPKKDKSDKGINIALVITGTICIGLIVLIALFIIVYPSMSEPKDVKIPDVRDKTVVEAEKMLLELGLKVNNETEEEHSDEVEEGLVVGTDPWIGKTVKEDTEITLIISSGEKGITLENYVGKNYYEVKSTLEAAEIYVLIDYRDVPDDDKTKENVILEQEPKVGTRVTKGDTVKLIVPNIINEYPDFVGEAWSMTDIQKFCEQYELILTIDYVERGDVPAGTVVAQSRAAKSKIVNGMSLKITVASKPNEGSSIDDVLPSGNAGE